MKRPPATLANPAVLLFSGGNRERRGRNILDARRVLPLPAAAIINAVAL
jgi:hypothetical protein